MHADIKVIGPFEDTFVARAGPLIERLANELRDVTLDMSQAETLDARGLGALVYLHKHLAPHGHKVRVVGANDDLIRRFEDFHVAELFIEQPEAVC